MFKGRGGPLPAVGLRNKPLPQHSHPETLACLETSMDKKNGRQASLAEPSSSVEGLLIGRESW